MKILSLLKAMFDEICWYHWKRQEISFQLKALGIVWQETKGPRINANLNQ